MGDPSWNSGRNDFDAHAPSPGSVPELKSLHTERWIDANGKRRYDLACYILSFSKGCRQCLGITYALMLEIVYCLTILSVGPCTD